MIELKINSKPYHIKTSFKEMTWGEFVAAISANNLLDRVSILSGIEREIIDAMPLQRLSEIMGLVSYFDEVESVAIIADKYQSDLVIGHESYGKLEQAKQQLKANQSNPMKAGAAIVKIYTGQEIESKPLLQVYGMVSFFLSTSQSL
jgi:hypothetical protein